MGNRANIVFKQNQGCLGLYLHNAGDFMRDVAVAIKRVSDAGRIHDIGYATRIAVSNIIGNDWSQDYSYGLYVGTTIDEAIADNEHDIVVVDWDSSTVSIHGFDFSEWKTNGVKDTYTLHDFIRLHGGR